MATADSCLKAAYLACFITTSVAYMDCRQCQFQGTGRKPPGSVTIHTVVVLKLDCLLRNTCAIHSTVAINIRIPLGTKVIFREMREPAVLEPEHERNLSSFR